MASLPFSRRANFSAAYRLGGSSAARSVIDSMVFPQGAIATISTVIAATLTYSAQAVATVAATTSAVTPATISYVEQTVLSVARVLSSAVSAFVNYIGKQLVGAGAEISAGVRRISMAIRIGV